MSEAIQAEPILVEPVLEPGWLRRVWGWDLVVTAAAVFSPAVAAMMGARWEIILGLGIVALLMVMLVIQRRGGLGLVGPHFFYDLVRLGRRARTWDVRILYALLLAIGLGLVYFLRFPVDNWKSLFVNDRSISLNESAEFSATYVFTIVFLQNLAVLILTPAYLASVVAEEREKGTLELLFTTHLRSHQILLGKYFSRLIHMGAILLCGLPILSLIQLWGGVDIRMLGYNFVVLFMNLLFVGSVSILASVLSKRVVNAVMISYGIVLPFGLCVGVMSFVPGSGSYMGMREPSLIILITSIVFQGFVTAACLVASIFILRTERNSDRRLAPLRPRYLRRRPPTPRPGQPSRVADAEDNVLTVEKTRSYDLPPIHSDPLYWKESNLGYTPFWKSPVFYVVLALALYAVLGMFLSISATDPWHGGHDGRERFQFMTEVVRFFFIVYAGLFALSIGFRAAGGIVRERAQKTLDSLLSVPMERGEILRSKWLGCYNRSLSWLIGLGIMCVLGMMTTATHIVGIPLMAAGPFIHAAFFCSFGLYLSVVCRTVLESYVKLALTVLVLIVGTWLAGAGLAWARAGFLADFVEVGLNPLRTWHFYGFSYSEFAAGDPELDRRYWASLLGLAIYAGLAWLFWWMSCRAFAKEKYRHVE